MASRLILKDIKAPIHFLLRNPARATAPVAQPIQNLLVPIPTQSAAEFVTSGFVGRLGLNDRPLLSRDLKSTFDGGFRIEVRGNRLPVVEDDDVPSESESDFEDFDDICGDDCAEENFEDDFDTDDAEPRDWVIRKL